MATKIQKIGVIGAGQMGNGIAHVCAIAGKDVFLSDLSQEQLDNGFATIQKNLDRQARKGRITEKQVSDAMGRIKLNTTYDDFTDCDIIIEAASENEDVKKEIIKQVCEIIPPHTIFASNTSSISITRLGAQSDRPGKFVGMHFMNPVPMMALVELIRGIATDEPTYSAVRELTLELNKKPVNAEDFPAFIVNRILLPMINEAVYTLYEGVGSVEAIDSAMRMGANHPMGPLQLADFIGLDTCLAIMHVLHDGLADTKYRPCPLLVKYVEAGWLGQKSGRGFYDYSGETPVPTR
ncbi:MAG: 3-hydroxybutyryl-CoA dehydrogenase [Rhodospirillales bacterium]|nr:3-hydroxybutyryl-CoA dehydrogenase [Rhodospirillales bacterium]